MKRQYTSLSPLFLLVMILASPLLTSCQMEDKIVSELGKPKYVIEDSDDPIDHLIYEIYKETGTQIIYNFDPEDAQWNLGTSALLAPAYKPIDISIPEKKEALAKSLQLLKSGFLDKYPVEFQKKYMPLRVFMCDSIGARRQFLVDQGRDHIAMNVYTPDDKKMTEEQYIKAIKPELHGITWRHIFTYRIGIPEHFMSFSGEWYGKNLPYERKDPDYDIRMDGFWSYDELNSFKFYHAIKAEEDIADYVVRMTTVSEAENMEAMKGFDIMISKYKVLREFIKQQTGLDLQQIGNNAK